MQLNSFKALSFDCYGTLIDWEGGIYEQLAPHFGAVANREQILEAFAKWESSEQKKNPELRYDHLLAGVYKGMCSTFGVESREEDALKFGESVGEWPAFPDSAAALQRLKKHYKLYILSNVDRHSFSKSNNRLGITFDGIFTAEDIGSYKPDLRNFQYMKAALEEQGIAAHEILHTAQSLFHDVQPANKVGLATAWIDRRYGKEGSGATSFVDRTGLRIDFHVKTLAEFADLVEGAFV